LTISTSAIQIKLVLGTNGTQASNGAVFGFTAFLASITPYPVSYFIGEGTFVDCCGPNFFKNVIVKILAYLLTQVILSSCLPSPSLSTHHPVYFGLDHQEKSLNCLSGFDPLMLFGNELVIVLSLKSAVSVKCNRIIFLGAAGLGRSDK
jgi:hypothetical protein